MLAAIVWLGEAGHHIRDHLGREPFHHLAHILILAGAVVAFAVYALADIRRHGRPSFSWTDRRRRPG